MQVNIREIEPRDEVEVLAMARAMHAESPRYSKVPYSEAKARCLFLALLPGGALRGNSIAFVAERDGKLIGMIGGAITEHFFSTCAKYATDLIIYVSPEERGSSAAKKLIGALEAWAWSHPEVNEVLLGVSTGVHSERTTDAFQRLGYKMAVYGLVKER